MTTNSNSSTERKPRVKSVELDGERVTFEDRTQEIEGEKWERKKKAARNPFGKIAMARISTQGPEK